MIIDIKLLLLIASISILSHSIVTKKDDQDSIANKFKIK